MFIQQTYTRTHAFMRTHMLKVSTLHVMNCRLSSAGHMMIYLICFEFHPTCAHTGRKWRASNARIW